MIYKIKRINRTVNLNDTLVAEYLKYDELREQTFSIAVRTFYGCEPTEEELSTDELSAFCNRVLYDELKTFAVLPKALEIYKGHATDFANKSPVEYPIC